MNGQQLRGRARCRVIENMRVLIKQGFTYSKGDTLPYGDVFNYVVDMGGISGDLIQEMDVISALKGVFPKVIVKPSVKYSCVFVNMGRNPNAFVEEELIDVRTEELPPMSPHSPLFKRKLSNVYKTSGDVEADDDDNHTSDEDLENEMQNAESYSSAARDYTSSPTLFEFEVLEHTMATLEENDTSEDVEMEKEEGIKIPEETVAMFESIKRGGFQATEQSNNSDLLDSSAGSGTLRFIEDVGKTNQEYPVLSTFSGIKDENRNSTKSSTNVLRVNSDQQVLQKLDLPKNKNRLVPSLEDPLENSSALRQTVPLEKTIAWTVESLQDFRDTKLEATVTNRIPFLANRISCSDTNINRSLKVCQPPKPLPLPRRLYKETSSGKPRAIGSPNVRNRQLIRNVRDVTDNSKKNTTLSLKYLNPTWDRVSANSNSSDSVNTSGLFESNEAFEGLSADSGIGSDISFSFDEADIKDIDTEDKVIKDSGVEDGDTRDAEVRISQSPRLEPDGFNQEEMLKKIYGSVEVKLASIVRVNKSSSLLTENIADISSITNKQNEASRQEPIEKVISEATEAEKWLHMLLGNFVEEYGHKTDLGDVLSYLYQYNCSSPIPTLEDIFCTFSNATSNFGIEVLRNRMTGERKIYLLHVRPRFREDRMSFPKNLNIRDSTINYDKVINWKAAVKAGSLWYDAFYATACILSSIPKEAIALVKKSFQSSYSIMKGYFITVKSNDNAMKTS